MRNTEVKATDEVEHPYHRTKNFFFIMFHKCRQRYNLFMFMLTILTICYMLGFTDGAEIILVTKVHNYVNL